MTKDIHSCISTAKISQRREKKGARCVFSNEFVCCKCSRNKKGFVLHTVCLNAPAAGCAAHVGSGRSQQKMHSIS